MLLPNTSSAFFLAASLLAKKANADVVDTEGTTYRQATVDALLRAPARVLRGLVAMARPQNTQKSSISCQPLQGCVTSLAAGAAVKLLRCVGLTVNFHSRLEDALEVFDR